MARLLFLVLLLISTAAGARMYQWQDPVSKSVQLSGVPPVWYRSPESGPKTPRVRVFEGGKLVDDTYIQLSDEDSKTMRDLAFRALKEERQLDAIKRLERAAMRERNRREQAEREARSAQAKSEQSDTSEAPPEVLPDSLSAEEVDRLKAIIAGYDRAAAADGNAPAATTAPSAQTPGKPASY